MGEASKDILVLLTQLFPGFLAAWVTYGLTSHPFPSQFERIVQALVYSFLIKVLVILEESVLLAGGSYMAVGPWDARAELLASTTTALCLGLALAYFTNNDKFYAFARSWGMTNRNAHPSEWYGIFSEHPRYIVLHIDGERRISGYPLQWPSDPSSGHFKLVDAAWINDDSTEVRLTGDDSVLVPAKSVQLVEFLKYVEEMKNGREAAEPFAAETA